MTDPEELRDDSPIEEATDHIAETSNANLIKQVMKIHECEMWRGDDMRVKGDQIGCRIAANNFQRKLYMNSRVHIEEVIALMIKQKINILVGTEPG